ncbi:spore germination protein [Paenibacillus sp. MMS18-CY102]|uniref:spore germination protein n=1 Tax=Paenibacillus sp. MMS18-CY102 TaxID=2682849 RepID=UPI001365BFA3|nr:spore germination protein [Paenibacillus sp. MMS18-CY102]MWC27947.1 spore germination protein [Paenibacillus sp. MMS18-CY102]
MKPCLSIEATEQYFNQLFSEQSDFISKSLNIGETEFRLFYFDTLIDSTLVQECILRPLVLRPKDEVREVVSILDFAETDQFDEAGQAIMYGKAVLFRRGESKLCLLGVDLKKERSINIPINERVLRGANEAFIENVDTNINLMRKLINTTDFVVKTYTIGRLSQTKVAVMYIKSIANPTIIDKLHNRLGSIDIDYVEAPGFIEELIREKKYSLFPQLLITERPDRARAYLMEGKTIISTAGSPDVIILPVTFWSFFQSPDDYHSSWLLGTVFRFLRICCFFITIGLPAFYVSVNAFNPQLLPINFVNTLQSSLKNVTFPPFVEALSMILLLEILREATIRLASPVGQTIGVVGGIVIGTVVVQSNLVSNTMVIVAALTGLASFIMPSYEMSSAVRLLCYPALILSSLFGLLGLVFFFMLICIHLCQMNTMGIPYFSPPFSLSDAKDTLFRAPIWSLRTRPRETAPSNRTRLWNPRSWKR